MYGHNVKFRSCFDLQTALSQKVLGSAIFCEIHILNREKLKQLYRSLLTVIASFFFVENAKIISKNQFRVLCDASPFAAFND